LSSRGYLLRADHSSSGVLPNVVRSCVWSRNLKNEETMARVGSQSHKNLYINIHGEWFQKDTPPNVLYLTWNVVYTLNAAFSVRYPLHNSLSLLWNESVCRPYVPYNVD
jgi:hypothetical protein